MPAPVAPPALPPASSSNLFLIGVIMAIAGNTLIACSLTLQKHVHNSSSGKPIASTPLFWLALVGMICGEVGNFAAFGFASPTVVSPLGAVAVIANALLAVAFLREAVFIQTLIGIALTVGGSVVVVIFAPPSVDKLTVDEFMHFLREPTAIAYLSAVGVAAIVLMLLEPRIGHRYLLVNLLVCSLLGSITVLCSSATSKFITQAASGDAMHVIRSPIPYLVLPVLAVTAVLQLRYLNKAMANFNSTQVVPVYYITFTLASISGGGVVLRDFWRFEAADAIGFAGGALLCFGGVLLITRKPTVVRPAGAHAPASAVTTDVVAPRDRLRSAITRVSHANTFTGRVMQVSDFVSTQMDVTVIGSQEAAQRTAERDLEPTVLGPGLGTMLSVRRASFRTVLPVAPPHTLATGLLAADAQQRPPAIPEADEAAPAAGDSSPPGSRRSLV